MFLLDIVIVPTTCMAFKDGREDATLSRLETTIVAAKSIVYLPVAISSRFGLVHILHRLPPSSSFSLGRKNQLPFVKNISIPDF